MVSNDIQQVERAWPGIAPYLFVPRTDQQYQRLVSVLDALIDTVGEDETHPLASMMEIIGVLVEEYEDEHVPEIAAV